MQGQASGLIFKGRITPKTGPAYHGPDIYSARRPIGFRAFFTRQRAAASCRVRHLQNVGSKVRTGGARPDKRPTRP
jgi:hypothetical protein